MKLTMTPAITPTLISTFMHNNIVAIIDSASKVACEDIFAWLKMVKLSFHSKVLNATVNIKPARAGIGIKAISLEKKSTIAARNPA